MKFLAILVFTTSIAFGAERPTMPKMGEKIELTGKKSAAEFFGARAADKACQDKMTDWAKKTEEALKDLAAAKANGSESEADDAETMWRTTRRKQLEIGEKCGPCVTAPVVKTIIPKTSRNEVWYVAEGACQYTGKNPTAENGFKTAVESLKQVNGYARATGGFEPMLEFLPFDSEKMALKEAKEIVPSPFFAVLGVKATEALGVIVGYRQLVEVAVNKNNAGDKKEFQVTFKGTPVPATVKLPAFVEKSAEGKDKRVKQFSLSELQASWYVNSEGYVHYYMAGEFGATLPFALEAGREAAREVLFTLHSRFK